MGPIEIDTELVNHHRIGITLRQSQNLCAAMS
jgi:hypothetical protein